MLIDSHCHLATFERAGTTGEVLERAREAGVSGLITVGTSSKDWDLYRELATRYYGTVFHTVGLHPCEVEENWNDEVMQVASHFTGKVQPVALGEIGLDYFHLPKYPDEAAEVKKWQEYALRRQLELVLQLDCPVIIHSRNAFEETVAIIDQSGVDWSKVVFHCFASGEKEISMLKERGAYGSFTGIFTYKSAEDIRAAALAQGLDRLMIETDCPYLTPVPMRGKPNEPAYLRYTAEMCAQVFGVSLEDLAEKTADTTKAFFGLPR